MIGDKTYDPSEIKPQKTECASKDSSQAIKYKADLSYDKKGRGLVPGKVNMRCGDDSWGLRHIDYKHGDGNGPKSDHSWRNIVRKHLGSSDWEGFVKFSVVSILDAPSGSSYRETNDTYNYTAPIKIIKNGKVKSSYYPLVSVSAESYNVISAYPRKKDK